MEISKVFLRFLSLDFLSPRLNFTASCTSFPPSLSFTHSHILSFVWHAITCIWHIYNNNNMLLVDNRHLGPPRSLIRTFFFLLYVYVLYSYTHIYIFIYLYNPKKFSACVCIGSVYVYVFSVYVFLSVQRSWTPSIISFIIVPTFPSLSSFSRLLLDRLSQSFSNASSNIRIITLFASLLFIILSRNRQSNSLALVE